MVFENLEVIHKSFGKGQVVSKSGQYITVKFANAKKIFVYPDVFEKYLTLADGSVSEDILADIAVSNAQKQKILDKKRAENDNSRLRGIVIPGKEITGEEHDDEDGNYKSAEREEI